MSKWWRKAKTGPEQHWAGAQAAPAAPFGWQPEQAAELVENLCDVMQLVAASVDAGGDFELMTVVWGRRRGMDAPSLVARDFGHVRGALWAAAESWGLSLERMGFEEMRRATQLRGAARERASQSGQEYGGWVAEDAGRLAETLAVVSYAAAATIAARGQFAFIALPFDGDGFSRKDECLAAWFGQARGGLEVMAELWGLSTTRMADAERDAITDLTAQ